MTHNKQLVVVGILAASLGAGQMSAEAAQRGNGNGRQGRTEGRSPSQGRQDQGGAAGRDQPAARDRGTASAQARDRAASNGQAAPREQGAAPRNQRESAPATRDGGQQDRQAARQDNQRSGVGDRRGDNDGRRVAPGRPPARGEAYRYSAPRVAPRVYVAPRVVPRGYVGPSRGGYYGPRNRLDLYFSFGSGYRYGSPYSGRVYGYVGPGVSYARRYYGDLRLQVRPRDAAVYVDGYFAGVVDNFDGVFQRLTLEVGPHRVEIEAPGYETRSFDVYVDPNHTVDLRADLYPDRPY